MAVAVAVGGGVRGEGWDGVREARRAGVAVVVGGAWVCGGVGVGVGIPGRGGRVWWVCAAAAGLQGVVCGPGARRAGFRAGGVAVSSGGARACWAAWAGVRCLVCAWATWGLGGWVLKVLGV